MVLAWMPKEMRPVAVARSERGSPSLLGTSRQVPAVDVRHVRHPTRPS